MAPGDPRVRLVEIVSRLNDIQAHKLLKFAEAFLLPIDAWMNPQSNLVTEAFAKEFEARLQLHHATHSKQLDRVGLEDAVRAASIAAGRSVHGPMGATRRFIDEIIDGERFAIKSTAALNVSEQFLHISKVSEAAWIQDVRGAQARAEKAKQQILSYMTEVDRLIQLRILPDREKWRYQLVEIPMSLLRPILDLDRNLFAPDGPTIPIVDGRGPCLTLKLDRSDAKITFTRIPISRCIIHARWTLDKKPGDA
ncbi:hypothetical protein [Micromonospora sp. IBHARD004]|uniref:hypothetical protein n=1 Tax=Micromonospora sp. IBHARD004 TaxID=3457764 RepID=UPI004058DF1E